MSNNWEMAARKLQGRVLFADVDVDNNSHLLYQVGFRGGTLPFITAFTTMCEAVHYTEDGFGFQVSQSP